MLTPRLAVQADIEWMAPRLRLADQQEVMAAGYSSPLAALQSGFNDSDRLTVGVDEQDRPVVIFGRCPMDPLAAAIWLLATDEISKHRVSFLRQSRHFVDEFHKGYPVLFNLVDERNELHVNWLRWLGLTFLKRHPSIGPENRPFLEFVSYKPCALPPS
jgi:hypothetical protein